MTKSTWALAFALWGCTAFAAQSGFNPDLDGEQNKTDLIVKQLNPQVTVQIVTDQRGPAPIEVIQLAMTDYFAVNYNHSYEIDLAFPPKVSVLSEKAKRSLVPLGYALRSDALKDYAYLIGAHTDVRGEETYNDQLTHFRAKAVKEFLVTEFAIEPDRLFVVGWGERKLKHPQSPLAPTNRRIEISLITDDMRQASPNAFVPLWSFVDFDDWAIASSIEIARILPNLAQPMVHFDGTMVAVEHMECADKVAHDPRPQQHDLDDFNTGRTPLKCEQQAQEENRSVLRVKVR